MGVDDGPSTCAASRESSVTGLAVSSVALRWRGVDFAEPASPRAGAAWASRVPRRPRGPRSFPGGDGSRRDAGFVAARERAGLRVLWFHDLRAQLRPVGDQPSELVPVQGTDAVRRLARP
jgi:hypothetical protein